MSNKLSKFFIKQANNYLRLNAGRAKEVPVPPVSFKPKTEISLGSEVHKVSDSGKSNIAVNGKNSEEDDKGYMYPLLHPWNNTISGTGFGQRYWTEPTNPFST